MARRTLPSATVSDQAPARWWPTFALLAAVAFLTAAHLPVVAWNAYGSDDAAWDGIAILLWSQHDRLPTETGLFVEERFRSSPLPAYLTRRLLAAGVLRPSDVPLTMNLAAASAGVILPGLLFLLVRQLASAAEGVIASVLLLLSPEFFSLKLDGMPTLPATVLLLVAVWCFVGGMQPSRSRPVLLALSALFLAAATLTKVDVILLSPALLVASLVLPRPKDRWKYVALSAALSVACVLAWHFFCRWAAPEAPDTGETFQRWSQRWGIVPDGLWDLDNRTAMLMAPGVGTVLALLPAAVWCWYQRQTRWLVVAAVVCSLPTILFWGMRELNSSRHNFWLVLPLAVLVAVAVHRAIGSQTWKVLAVVAIGAGNYFLGPPPERETYRQATSHFFSAALARQVRVQQEHQDYELVVRRRGPIRKLCIWDVGPARARAIAVFVSHSVRCEVRVDGKSHNDWWLEPRIGGDKLLIWLPDAPELSDIWPEICREEYDVLMPCHESAPFIHFRGDPRLIGSPGPQTLELWPASGDDVRS